MAQRWLRDTRDPPAAHVLGNPEATRELAAELYAELRRIAGNLMRWERPDHTLQPTELVNESYLRLIAIDYKDWQGRAHFCNMAAKVMRRVLCDHAHKRNARKRGGGLRRITLDPDTPTRSSPLDDLLALDEALDRLAGFSNRSSTVASMRIFGGMRIGEIAHRLDLSKRTVVDDWSFARAWLARELLPRS